MKNLICLTLLFLFSWQSALANFIYSNEEKVARAKDMSLTFTGKESGSKISAQASFTLEFTSNNKVLWLPKITLKLDQFSDAEAVSLSYNEARSNNISKELYSTLQHEVNKEYPMVPVNGDYVSPFWGFLRTQHFLALFIKNSTIDINVTLDGEVYTAPVSLKGTTIAYYRYVWYVVHPQIKEAGVYDPVPNYLTLCQDKRTVCGKGTRKKRTSYGYGMSEHGAVDTSLPEDLTSENLSLLDPENYEQAFATAEKIYELFLGKTNLTSEVEEITNNKDFINNSAQLITLFDEIRHKWTHSVQPIIGAGDDKGFLKDLKAREEELIKLLAELEASIEELTNEKVSPMTEEARASGLAFRDHQRVLFWYNREIQALEKRLDGLKADLAEFTGLLETYSGWLSENTGQDFELKAPLFNGVEVREVHDAQIKRHQRLAKVAQLKEELQLAINDISSLVEGAEAVIKTSEDILEFYSQRSQLIAQIEAYKAEVDKLENRFPKKVRERQAELLKITDEETRSFMGEGQQRTPENEIVVIRLLIRRHYDQLDTWLDEHAPALKMVVCSSAHYKSYKEKFKGLTHCLDPFDLTMDPEKISFYETLSPREIDTILATFIDEPLNPWNKEVSKLDLLAELAVQAIDDAQSILINPFGEETLGSVFLTEWATIQYLRWQLRIAKAMNKQAPNDVMTAEFYVAASVQFETNLNDQLIMTLEGLKNQLGQMDESKPELLAQSRSLKESYELSAQAFVDRYITPAAAELALINGLGEMPVAESTGSCYFPIAELDQCEQDLGAIKASADEVELTEKTNDLQTTFLMVESLKALISDLSSAIKKTTADHAFALSGKNEYREKNNIDELERERGILLAELEAAQTRLTEQKELKSQTEVNIRLNEYDQVYQASKLSELSFEISELSKTASPLVEAIQPICRQVIPKVSEIKTLEEGILTLVSGEEKKLEASSVAPSCSLPPLSEFQVVTP